MREFKAPCKVSGDFGEYDAMAHIVVQTYDDNWKTWYGSASLSWIVKNPDELNKIWGKEAKLVFSTEPYLATTCLVMNFAYKAQPVAIGDDPPFDDIRIYLVGTAEADHLAEFYCR